ncbi:MAG: hypothetical protein KA144_14875 [Xanthomonadaceae bacterium]|nr:hypothetical protein [Xanthomonadaceae bacterium]
MTSRRLSRSYRARLFAAMSATVAFAACSGVVEGDGSPGPQDAWIFGGQYSMMAGDPSLLRTDDGYRMYYSCYAIDISGTDICTATSKDGMHWTMPKLDDGDTRGRVLFATRDGANGAHETPEAIRVGGETWLYVVAYADARGGFFKNPSHLSLARSKDGLHFRLDPTPLLSPEPDGLDDHGITSSTVIHDDDGWRMVYTGWCLEPKRCPRTTTGRYTALRGATSPDGIHWTRKPGTLIDDSALPAWSSSGIAETHVVRASETEWLLLFTALNGDAPKSLGIATGPSPFGPWSIAPKPLLRGEDIAAWADKGPVAPHGLVENGRLRVWYAGEDSKTPAFRMGYAEFPWPRR